MKKNIIKNIIVEIILIAIKDNIDYYFSDDQYFKTFKSLLNKSTCKKECYKLLNQDNIYMMLIKDTLKDLQSIPYIHEFSYDLQK